MKVSLIGICQVVGMASVLKKAFPDAEVLHYHVHPTTTECEDILGRCKGSDLIISQILPVHGIRPFEEGRLRPLAAKFELIPPLVFNGFHPDMCILPVTSPIESYHSRIIAAAYTMGLPSDQAADLLNRFVFNRLGYFDHFENAKSIFLEDLDKYGYGDVARAAWPSWMADGCFMHTPNHPKLRVLASFALAAMQRAGIRGPDTILVDDLEDIFFNQHGCPLYPEIGKALGVVGETWFRAYKSQVPTEEARFMDAPTFAARCYSLYDEANREALLDNPAIAPQRAQLSEVVAQI